MNDDTESQSQSQLQLVCKVAKSVAAAQNRYVQPRKEADDVAKLSEKIVFNYPFPSIGDVTNNEVDELKQYFDEYIDEVTEYYTKRFWECVLLKLKFVC
jgi:hypothetical protein